MARTKKTDSSNETTANDSPVTEGAPIAHPTATEPVGSVAVEAPPSSTNTDDGSVVTADSPASASAGDSFPTGPSATADMFHVEHAEGAATDGEAPYGRDADGRPLAPYGVKADGSPKRKPGRAGSGAPRERKPREKSSENGSPVERDETTVEGAALALVSDADDGGWFSRSQDAKRCARAKENAGAWRDIALVAIEFGEGPLAMVVESQLARDSRIGPERARKIAAAIPRMRTVPVSIGGKATNVAEANAEALSFVLAYLVPYKPSHPLLRAAMQLALSQYAYFRAINTAVAKAMEA